MDQQPHNCLLAHPHDGEAHLCKCGSRYGEPMTEEQFLAGTVGGKLAALRAEARKLGYTGLEARIDQFDAWRRDERDARLFSDPSSSDLGPGGRA